MASLVDTLLIDAVTPEIRIAHVSCGELIDIGIFRGNNTVRTGDIILGRVKAVIPSIPCAFVEIGDSQDGFLPLTEKQGCFPVRVGSTVLVQIRREAMGDKGARLTDKISLIGHYCIYKPGQSGINVSRKGSDKDLADMIVATLSDVLEEDEGAIVRTSALSLGKLGIDRIVSNVISLRKIWSESHAHKSEFKPPHCLIPAPNPVVMAMHSLNSDHLQRIIVEGAEMVVSIKNILNNFEIPEEKLLIYDQEINGLFEEEGIEEKLDAALLPLVPLPSGGWLHIHETPACITIDVDSGSSEDGKGRDLACRTNLEAAKILMREIRLRNLSGKIVIDFIHNNNRNDGHSLLKVLEGEISKDPIPAKVMGFTKLGMVEVLRRRRSTSLSELLLFPRGSDGLHQKTPETLAYQALRKANSLIHNSPGQPIIIKSHSTVISVLCGRLNNALENAKKKGGVAINLKTDPGFPMDTIEVYTG